MATTPLQQVQDDSSAPTSGISQSAWYWAAMTSVAASALMWLVGKRDWSVFVGQWPPTFLLLALFHRQSSRTPRR